MDLESSAGWAAFVVCGLGNNFPLLVSLGQTYYEVQDTEVSWCFHVHKSIALSRTC